MTIAFPDIDPIIFQVGILKISWYSLSYVVGILLSWWYIKSLNQFSAKIIDDLITYIIIGIIVGGRLGYVLFYDLNYNLEHPSNIIKTWNGGMSFHGGLIGVIIATWIFAKIHGISFLAIMDLCAIAAPIGLFFGRIANFINAELYGRVTDVPWAVIFPEERAPRHPSQLYESALEGALLFIIMYFAVRRTNAIKYKGMLSGIFLLLYALFREFIENYREPDAHLGFIFAHITMGQLLSAPMIIAGISLILFAKSKKSYF